VVAHRGGNTLDALRRAEALAVDLVEADVRLYRGRAVVRHVKSVGSLPLYWDRWAVSSPFSRFADLGELLAGASEDTELLLDLKGPRRRLAELVRAHVLPYLGRRRFTVCARSPRLLTSFEGLDIRRVASAGSVRQLRTLLRRHAHTRLDGIAVHERMLVGDAVVADIRRVADLVFSWPVNTPARARALLDLKVDGLISDRVERIAPVVSATAA
jgi:glycerophosphoryl diester phosphodiesterase